VARRDRCRAAESGKRLQNLLNVLLAGSGELFGEGGGCMGAGGGAESFVDEADAVGEGLRPSSLGEFSSYTGLPPTRLRRGEPADREVVESSCFGVLLRLPEVGPSVGEHNSVRRNGSFVPNLCVPAPPREPLDFPFSVHGSAMRLIKHALRRGKVIRASRPGKGQLVSFL